MIKYDDRTKSIIIGRLDDYDFYIDGVDISFVSHRNNTTKDFGIYDTCALIALWDEVYGRSIKMDNIYNKVYKWWESSHIAFKSGKLR